MTGPDAAAMNFSFVIPTFNRAVLAGSAVRSALAWLGDHTDGEIIVVDDGSTDGTREHLQQHFAHAMARGVLRLVPLAKNGGVIKAKNAGARAASGTWLIFLDSDDEIIPAAAAAMRRETTAFPEVTAIFFGCENFVSGELIGRPLASPVTVTLHAYLNGPDHGEKLPVVRRVAARQFPYEERLNGWEGLAYARMLRAIGPLVISPVVARRYRTDGDDRLSSSEGIRRRARSMALGNWLLAREFLVHLKPHRTLRHLAKAAFYSLR